MELQDRLEQRSRLHADEHDAVTEPFGDAHATPGADVAQQRAERGQDVDRALVALQLGQPGEPRHVDEGEAAMDSHAMIVPCRCARSPIPAAGGPEPKKSWW